MSGFKCPHCGSEDALLVRFEVSVGEPDGGMIDLACFDTLSDAFACSKCGGKIELANLGRGVMEIVE